MKSRKANESAARHAMPRSESMPSKYPIDSSRKYARRQAGPAHRLGVEARALRFSEIVESVLAQELIQPPIEGVLTAVGRSVTATHI